MEPLFQDIFEFEEARKVGGNQVAGDGIVGGLGEKEHCL